MNTKIKEVFAREILDSRGNPTIEVEISNGKITARAAVPSGASTGVHEALELRDGGKRYGGKGVLKAVENVNRLISKKIIGMPCSSPEDQRNIDEAMIKLDGTKNKSRLGANAILGVSLAAARLNAMSNGISLHKFISIIKTSKQAEKMPTPFMNIINGGKHAGSDLKFQEFMIAPKGKTFADSLRMGSEVYHTLKSIIEKKYGKQATNVGDEGGFAPNLKSAKEALDLITEAISKAGYTKEVKIAMDCAASEFYDEKSDKYFAEGRYYTRNELSELYKNLAREYSIILIEDPFHEEDFEGFAKLTKDFSSSTAGKEGKIQVVGDDLLVTNVERIRIAMKKGACSSLLLKVNQIGSLTETIEAADLAMNNGWNVLVSHRSGETEDSFIADLVVGLGCGQIKSGAPCRAERTAKYNQLLRIEEKRG